MFLPPLPASLPLRSARRRRPPPGLALLGLSLACLCGLGRAGGAATLSVPSQYQTIQAAVNAASNGDTVDIAPGTYTGAGNVDVDFGGKGLTVRSQYGPTATFIDCGGTAANNHRGFYLHSGETGATISGLTIQNGYTSDNGGGINASSVSVTVQNCVFKNNTANGGFGGGLYDSCEGGPIAVSQCTFTGNAAYQGGGMYNAGSPTGNLIVTDCVVTGNSTSGQYGGQGGGAYNFNFQSGLVALVNCLFAGNTANAAANGSPNSGLGGGIVNDNEGTGTIADLNCTVSGNTAAAAGSGGVYVVNYTGTAHCTLTNDVVYGDVGGEIGGAGATASHCDVAGGYPGAGDVNAAPLFVNPSMDFHLKPGSPCLGAGTPTGAPTTDADGNPRPSPPAIGAYDGPAPLRSSALHLLWSNPDGKAAFWDVAGDGTVPVAVGFGPFADGSSLWHATALATGPDGVSHILWNNPDGKVALWNVPADGSVAGVTGFGPYADGPSLWRASGVSVGPDNVMHLLWTNPDHKAAFWSVTPGGSASVLAGYGPFFDGSSPWDAAGVSTGPDNVSHLLWDNADGTAAFWNVSDLDGSVMVKGGYGPFTDGSASNLWGAIGLSTGPDNVSHLLWSNPDGKAAFWNVSNADGSASVLASYGPYTDGTPSQTWSVTGLTTGPDGVPRLLWNNVDGKAALWTLGASASIGSVFGYGPYTDGSASNLWSAVGVSAGP